MKLIVIAAAGANSYYFLVSDQQIDRGPIPHTRRELTSYE